MLVPQIYLRQMLLCFCSAFIPSVRQRFLLLWECRGSSLGNRGISLHSSKTWYSEILTSERVLYDIQTNPQKYLLTWTLVSLLGQQWSYFISTGSNSKNFLLQLILWARRLQPCLTLSTYKTTKLIRNVLRGFFTFFFNHTNISIAQQQKWIASAWQPIRFLGMF